MRYGIFSDVHGNLEALQTCLETLRAQGAERFVCLGDTVGYGAEPDACVSIVRCVADVSVIGNHDAATVGRLDPTHAHSAARRALDYSRGQLTPDNAEWLASLRYVEREGDICFCHGSPINAEEFEYVFSLDKAAVLTGHYPNLAKVTFVGHSHLTTAYLVTERMSLQVNAPRFQLRSGVKYVFNVGSVGQPRDRDKRACCVLYDTEERTVSYLRVDYDVDSAASKIMKADLPPAFGQRLFHGV